MATFEEIYLKNISIEDAVNFFKEFYITGSTDYLDKSNIVRFYESGNRTFIFAETTPHWTKFETDFENIFEFDEILRRLSENHLTIIMLLYKQTTSGDARFAIFENGKMIRSVYQEYVEHLGTMRLTQNFGLQLDIESNFVYPKIYREPIQSILGKHDLFHVLKSLGYEAIETNGHKEILHIEVLEPRN